MKERHGLLRIATCGQPQTVLTSVVAIAKALSNQARARRSGSTCETVSRELSQDKPLTYFPIVTAEDVQASKPAPDLFDVAAQELEIAPNECFIVGDSVWDVLAGRRMERFGCGCSIWRLRWTGVAGGWCLARLRRRTGTESEPRTTWDYELMRCVTRRILHETPKISGCPCRRHRRKVGTHDCKTNE
jgi:hypothetical protein